MKTYLTTRIRLILTFIIISSSVSFGQRPVRTDIYGRDILNTNGKRINYAQSDPIPEIPNLKKTAYQSLPAASNQSNGFKDTVNLHVDNLYSLMGSCIGRNSMHSMDIDGDGMLEIICTANSNTFGYGDYWYIMRYDPSDSSYNQVWTSSTYDTRITTLEIIDFKNDNHFNIILGFENGLLQVYDAKTRSLIKEAKPVNEAIKSIVFADADNDSIKDIMISCDYTSYILNAENYAKVFTIPQGGDEVRIGNVDDDPHNEIVLSSGIVYRLVNSVLETVWNMGNSYGGGLELSDIDNDSKLEIILSAGWYSIKVLDADTRTIKYTLTTDIDIDALYVKDINNDGVVEILYGDGQWGSIHCYNSVTQAKMWEVDNPEHGVTAINFADVNNDGKDELIWGAGWTSTGSDYLYVYDVAGNKLLWRSDDLDGPFYAVARGDVDNDGIQEIVAISYQSESGYDSGIILIIDSQTNKLKWKCNGNFLYGVWTGIFDLSIKDVDGDGINEIIVAAGAPYTGKIWIVDGKNHVIKSSYLFSTEGINEFYSIETEDIDNDGKPEFVAMADGGLYVINSTDWSVKWRVTTEPNYVRPVIRCSDLNQDGKKEIIICQTSIQIINGSDHSLWVSPETDFVNIDTFDYNTDGITDIVATTKGGHIKIMDGKTKEILKDLSPENSSIASVRVRKLDNSVIFVYSCDGRVNFYKNDSSCVVSQFLGSNMGEIEGFKIYEDQSDTSAILIGTSLSVLKVAGGFIHCVNLNIQMNISEVSCDKTDGKISLQVTGGSMPYEIEWNDGSHGDSLIHLHAGNYRVTVKDNNTCVKTKNITLINAYIAADFEIVNVGCNDKKGSVHLNITHVNAPYVISWSNSQNGTELENLDAGEYAVVITDSKNCRFEGDANVSKDTVLIYANLGNVTCNGMNNGNIEAYVYSGIEPFTYLWNTGSHNSYMYGLAPGKYKVSVTDAMGCKGVQEFNIIQPDGLSYEILVSPDNIGSPAWDGKIMINNITGGNPPYNIYWPRFSKYADYLETLPAGDYEFIVMDANFCQVKDTAIIESFGTGLPSNKQDPFYIYPNPARDFLYISNSNRESSGYSFELFNGNGQVVKNRSNINTKVEKIDLSGLKPGLYIMKCTNNNSLFSRKILVQ
jgi:hypothetical protein